MAKKAGYKFIIQENDVNYYVWWTICRDFVGSEVARPYLGGTYKKHLIMYENGNGNWGTILDDWHQLAENLINDIITNDFDLDGLLKQHYIYGERVEAKCREIEQKDLSKIDDKYLIDWFNDTVADYLILNEYGLIPVMSDVETGLLSSKMKEILIDKGVKEDKVAEAVNKLSTSSKKHILWQEETDLLEIAIKYQNLEALKKSKKFENHVDKYKWINFGYVGPDWQTEDFIYRVKELKERGYLKEILKERVQYLEQIKKERQELEKDLKLTEKEKFVFKVARDFSFIKNYRVGVRHYFCYISRNIFDSLSKKLKMPIDVFYYSSQDELVQLIQGKIKDYTTMLARKNFFCEYREGNNFSYLSRQEFAKMKDQFVEEDIQDTDELKGQPAFLGKVEGAVKIISGVKDIDKVEEGDILVAVYTDPNLLPAMKKAAAFVTEQGGITSHAAIVAREMKKPCVIGTKVATKVFKDGDIVEVNANQGIITRK